MPKTITNIPGIIMYLNDDNTVEEVWNLKPPKITWKKVTKSGYVLGIDDSPSTEYYSATITIGNPEVSSDSVESALLPASETIFAIRKSSEPADINHNAVLLAILSAAFATGTRVKVVGEQMWLKEEPRTDIAKATRELVNKNLYPYIKVVYRL